MKLLERDAQLADLSALLQRATTRQGQFAVVRGEAGVGKTSLTRALMDRVPGGVRCWAGTCDPLEPPAPLGPFYDIASAHGQLTNVLAGRLAPPELARDLERRLREPTLVVLEDVHWTDDATADVLIHLARRITRTRALLVLTHRTGADERQPGLSRLLAAVSGVGRTWELQSLSPDAVAALARDVAVDPVLLHRRTGGNPFYVGEVLACGDGGVPPTVAAAVLGRMDLLTAGARAVVDLVSLAPDGLSLSLVHAVLGRPAGEGLREAHLKGALRLSGTSVSFRHELAREAVEQELSGPVRYHLQQRLVEVLETGATVDVRLLAHYARGCADTGRVRRYALQAARAAYEQGANHVAVSHLESILELPVELDTEELAEVRELLADARDWVVDRAANLEARLAAAEAWARAGRPARQARQVVLAAGCYHHRGDVPSGVQAVRRACSLVDGLPLDEVVAEVLATACVVTVENASPPEAAESVRRLLGRLEDADAPVALAKVLRASAWLRIRGGDLEGGLADGHRSLAVARRGARHHLSQHTVVLAEALTEVREDATALPLIDEALRLARERDQPGIAAYARALRGRARLHQGRLDLAEEDTRPIEDLNMLGETVRTSVLLTCLARRGRPEAGDVHDPMAWDPSWPDPSFSAAAAAARAELCVLHDDLDTVADVTGRALRQMTHLRHPWAVGELRYWRHRAGIDDGPVPDWIAAPWRLLVEGSWSQAAQEWARHGAPFERALALSEGPVSAQRRALDLMTRIGATAWGDVVRESLRRAGAEGVPVRPRTHGDDLTARQQEVLGLVSQGLTDVQIAARLHVSVKTVGHHVSAILRRTGARNRTAAAAMGRRGPDGVHPGLRPLAGGRSGPSSGSS